MRVASQGRLDARQRSVTTVRDSWHVPSRRRAFEMNRLKFPDAGQPRITGNRELLKRLPYAGSQTAVLMACLGLERVLLKGRSVAGI